MRRTAAVVIAVAAMSLAGCLSYKVSTDSSGLRTAAGNMLLAVDRYQAGRVTPPDELSRFLIVYDPFSEIDAASDRAVSRGSLTRWELDRRPWWRLRTDPTAVIHGERLSLPTRSAVRDGAAEQAVFHLYYRGSLQGKTTILWVPGYGVSDFAFHFIRHIFLAALDRGYAVLFATIPGHLERIRPGEQSGEALLSADPVTNLRMVADFVGDLAAALVYMAERGSRSYAGWGGSMGAAFLLLLSERIEFEHIALMIPVLDWSTILNHTELKPVLDRLATAGYDPPMVLEAYNPVSPVSRTLRTDPSRVLIQYAQHDQLTPEATTRAYADARGITQTIGYRESHASILLNRRLYRDYAAFLDRMREQRR